MMRFTPHSKTQTSGNDFCTKRKKNVGFTRVDFVIHQSVTKKTRDKEKKNWAAGQRFLLLFFEQKKLRALGGKNRIL
jgi:hypothetical protein